MKLTNPTDEQLNAVFAEKVAGMRFDPDEGWRCKDGFSTTAPDYNDFTRSADAVLPWLDRVGWTCDNSYDEVVRIWGHRGRSEHFIHTDKSFPRAAVIALLRARGVEVEFTK